MDLTVIMVGSGLILFGIASAVIAGRKRRDVAGWFFLGILLSVFAVIVIALLPPLRAKARPAESRVADRAADSASHTSLTGE